MRKLRSVPLPPLFALPLALLANPAALAQDGQPTAAARETARQHIADSKKVRLEFRVHDACDDLLAADAATRRRAADYLHALLVELSTDAKRPREGEDHDAFRERQWSVQRVLGELPKRLAELPLAGDCVEVAVPLLWLWEHAEDGEGRAQATFALTAVRAPEVDRFFQSIVREGSSVHWAVCYALEQAGKRDLPVDADALVRLCGHYQQGVRERARNLAQERGLTAAAYTVEQSFGPQLERILSLAATLTPCEIPADARFGELAMTRREGDWSHRSSWQGWLLRDGDSDGKWEMMTSYGMLLRIEQTGASFTPSTIPAYVDHLVSERVRYDATEDFEVRRSIEGSQGLRRFSSSSSDTWQGSAAELLVAAWCFTRGDRPAAAKLLLEPLSKVWDTRERTDPMLHELAAELDEAMLGAFGAADYTRALALAGKLVAPELAGFRHQDRARDLLAQLPDRGDDFRGLQLPTPDQWKVMQREQPRAEQIEYLVQRLRLLRCQQWSNPGGISYTQEQYGVVPGEPPPLPDFTNPPKDVRVNPFAELLHLNLQANELPLLLPALETRDYILAFDLARFLPQRPQNLHRVVWVAASICNEVAQAALVDPRQFLGSEDDHKAAREALLVFAQRHGDQTGADRLAARMGEIDDWQDIRRAFWNLNTLDPVRAAAAMRQVGARLPGQMPQIVRLFALLDRGEFIGEALDWLRADDADQRFFAAVLLLRHRQEAEAAFRVIDARVKEAGAAELVPGAVEALLACDLPAARELLAACLAGTHVSGYEPSFAFTQRLLRAGMPEALKLLDDALAGKRRMVRRGGEMSDAQARQYVLFHIAQWWPGDPDDLTRLDDPASVEKETERLREALRTDWQRIAEKATPTMLVTEELDLPWGDLLSFSSGWIRRM